jgi:hypothetical protein
LSCTLRLTERQWERGTVLDEIGDAASILKWCICVHTEIYSRLQCVPYELLLRSPCCSFYMHIWLRSKNAPIVCRLNMICVWTDNCNIRIIGIVGIFSSLKLRNSTLSAALVESSPARGSILFEEKSSSQVPSPVQSLLHMNVPQRHWVFFSFCPDGPSGLGHM